MHQLQIKTFILVAVLTSGLLGAHHYVQKVINTQSKAPESPQSLQKVIQPNAFFYSGSVTKRDQTQISINYVLGGFPHVMYVDLVVGDGTGSISRLVTHPLLTTLNWEYAESNGIRLYQKTKIFDSLDEFVAQPPDGQTILADEALLITNTYKDLHAKPLNEFATLDGIAYIVTTYVPSQPLGNGYRYQAVLDASNALINLKNELVWHIRVPTATPEHPFYLGGVEVHYQ